MLNEEPAGGAPPEPAFPRPLIVARPAMVGTQPCAPLLCRTQAIIDIVVVVLVMGLCFVTATPLLLAADEPPSLFAEVGLMAIPSLIAVFGVNRWRQRSWADLGLGGQNWWGHVGLGLALVVPLQLVAMLWSLILFVATMAISDVDVEALAEQSAPVLDAVSTLSIGEALLVMIVVGFYEEVLFRGFLLGRLRTVLASDGWAVAVSAAMFGLLHYFGQGWLGVAKTLLLGVLLALLTLHRKSLWTAIVSHAGVNFSTVLFVLVLSRYVGPVP